MALSRKPLGNPWDFWGVFLHRSWPSEHRAMALNDDRGQRFGSRWWVFTGLSMSLTGLPSGNQTWQWKIHYLWVIFLLKLPFIGDFPLPCMITGGYRLHLQEKLLMLLYFVVIEVWDPVLSDIKLDLVCAPVVVCISWDHPICEVSILHRIAHVSFKK